MGPLIGGAGAIINVVDDDVADFEEIRATSRPRDSGGRAGRLMWIVLLSLLCGGAGFTVWRMHARASTVDRAIAKARQALRTGSLARYREAHKTVAEALKKDRNNPDLRAWSAKLEARMALEYMVQIQRIPAAIFAVEKIHRKLRRNPPGLLRKLQVKLGLSYRTPDWGREALVEAQAIQQLLTGVKPRPDAKNVRARTVHLLDRAINRYPKALGLRYVRGLAHLANGNIAFAQQDLEETVKRDKDHVPAQLALAEVLLEAGLVVEAQERFTRVLGVNPDSMRARLGMIQTRLVRGKELAQAGRELKKLQPDKNTPRLIRSWYRLARAWLAWTTGRLEDASQGLEHAGQAMLPEARWLAWYIRLALLLGDVDRSRKPLVNGLAALRSAGDPTVNAFKLEVKLAQGLPKPVIQGAKKLLGKIDAKSPAARRTLVVLARALLVDRRYAKAVAVLKRLQELKAEPVDESAVKIYLALARGLQAQTEARQKAQTPPPKDGAKPGKKVSPAALPGTPAAGASAAGASAIALLKALAKGPAAPAARYAMALLTPDREAARTLLLKAVSHHRDAAMAGVRLAILQLSFDQVAEARKQLEQAMELAPAFYPALRVRARLRLRTGMISEALGDTTTLCFAGYRGSVPAGLLRRVVATADWSSKLARLDHSTLCPSAVTTPDDLVTRAAIYVAMDRPDALDPAWVLLAMGASQGAAPGRVGILRAQALMSGQATAERGKRAAAMLKDLAKGLPAVTSNPEYHLVLGKAQSVQKDKGAAAKAYQEALKLRPSYLPALQSLGWLLLAEGKHAEAAVLFKKATVLAKKYESCPVRVRSRLLFALGRSLMAKGAGKGKAQGKGKGKHQDLKDARAALTEALRLNDQLIQAAVELARVDIATNRLAAARKQLVDVLAAEPDYPDVLFLLARVLQSSKKDKVKDRAAAAKHVARLVKVCEQEIAAGRPDEGRWWLEQILARIDKAHPGASLALGALLAQKPKDAKEKNRARALLQQAAKSGTPDMKKRAAALLKKL